MQLQQPKFQALEKNMVDIIVEQQIKLGYRSETIRLYYPAESINRILGTKLSTAGLQTVLDQFCKYVEPRLGGVGHTHKDSRFCILVPPGGVDFVFREVQDRDFLTEFIDKIRQHDCSLEDLLGVFRHYSSKVVCEEMPGEEFDYLVYFEDGKPDAYRYCIKFEGCHATYHRFTKEDYADFEFDK
ncbi:MAG TPA: DUF3877 family protein [Clostridiales bacterium]|nr:DUF3877 family protein [Clostridiales bacterium]